MRGTIELSTDAMDHEMMELNEGRGHSAANVSESMILDVVEPLPESEPQHGMAPSVQEAHCLYSRGDIEAAEWELDRVLHRDPNDLAALLLLAVIEYNRDNTERALELCTRAAGAAGAGDPQLALYAMQYLQLAHQYRGSPRKSTAAFECALALDPTNAYAWCDYGNVFREQGRTADCERCFRTALEYDPRLAVAWNNLGCAALDASDAEQASAHFVKALFENPRLEVAYSNLLGLRDPASNSIVLYQLSCELVRGNRLDDAVVVLSRCLLVNPMNAQARGALGSVFHRQGRLVEARTLYEEAIRLAPGQFSECHINLGHLLRDSGDLQSARVSFLNGIQLSGGNADDYNHLACICKDLGMSTEAIAFYRLSLKFKADNPNVYCNLIHSLMMICDWRNVRAEMPKVVETVLRQLTKGEFPSIHPHHTFLYPIPNTARKSIAAAHARLAQTNAATFGRGPYNFDHLRQELGSRIRVGYVSSDFMDHPTAHLMQSVPEFHNRARVEVFCYALSADDRSTYRAKISAGAEHFVDLSGLTALARADRIYADRIHVLLDLNGYTRGASSEVFALKPAPVQAMWLGYPGTSGSPYMDYLISDIVTSPPELWEESFSEKLVLLPHTFFVGDHAQAYPLKQLAPWRVPPITPAHQPRASNASLGSAPAAGGWGTMSTAGMGAVEAEAPMNLDSATVLASATTAPSELEDAMVPSDEVVRAEAPPNHAADAREGAAATSATTLARPGMAPGQQPFTVPFVQTNYIQGAGFPAGFLTEVVFATEANGVLVPRQNGLVSAALGTVPPAMGVFHPAGEPCVYSHWMSAPSAPPLSMQFQPHPLVPPGAAPPPLVNMVSPMMASDKPDAAAATATTEPLPGVLFPQQATPFSYPSATAFAAATVNPVQGYYCANPMLQPHMATYGQTLQAVIPLPPTAVHVLEPEHCPTIGPFTKRTPQPPVTRTYYGLPEDAVVFCNFNQLYKLDSELFACWMRILIRAPKAVLWLLRFPAAGEANVLVEAQAAGVDARRVIFSDLADKTGHIRRGSLADMCLDTTRCNGHTTGMDILWGGTPLLTLPGETLAGRVSSSLVAAMGVPELICDDMSDYEDKAVRYATRVSELRVLQRKVRKLRATSALFNTRLRVKHLEDAFEAMIHRWFEGLPPDHIDLEASEATNKP